MAERLMAGEGNSSPEGSSTQTSQRGVAIAEKSLDQPNVVIADEGKEPKGPGFWRRITGEDTKPLVLVQQPQITEILNPVEQPENTQIPPTPQNQATTGEANAVNNQETQDGQGAGVGNLPPDRRDGGGGDNGGRDREPPLRGPEYETSPERGRSIVNEIIRLEATLSYTDRYKVKDGPLSTTSFKPEIYQTDEPYLNQLYKDLQSYVEDVCRVRNERDPWDPAKAYEAAQQPDQPPQTDQEVQGAPEDLTGLLPIDQLAALYEGSITPADQLPEIERQLSVYFKEAKRLGLLKSVDNILTDIKDVIESGIPSGQAREEMERLLARATRTAQVIFVNRRTNPEVDRLRGVWVPYLFWARGRFEDALDGQEQRDPREGEFLLDQEHEEEQTRETYWQPSSYPEYYVVTATTPEQFQTAKETFLEMVKGGGLGRSPDKILTHLENFAKAFGQRGVIQARAGSVTNEFVEEERVELEGISYIYGDDYTDETYDPANNYRFKMALALHEGPQRHVALARAGRGEVAPFLWEFDYDPVMILFHNPCGSRGQIANDTVTQHYFQDQIKAIKIEKGMGIRLKDYDPRDTDPNSPVKLLNTRAANREKTKYFRANLKRIGIHQPDEDFKNLYEGFDDGGAHITNFQRYGHLEQSQLLQLPKRLRDSIDLGRIQLEVEKLPLTTVERLKKGEKIDQLTDHDQTVWKVAYARSKTNFDIAFQMIGASGEKVRRGGGIFFVDRVDEKGNRFVDHMPIYLAEKAVQYVITRTKIQYANASAKDRTEAVTKALTMAIKKIKQDGFETEFELPVVKFDAQGNVVGMEGTEKINFQTAVESIYSRWTSHTYWGYQQENRHMILAPHIFEAAKRIRAGLSRPKDEDILATHLLILDPTLKRVARLSDDQMRPGESAMQAEIILLEAAVEDSYQGHWRINRELHKAFLPEDGNAFKIRFGYNLEDYGGYSRFVIRIKEFYGAHPKRFARRYAPEIANAPMEVSSGPDMVGAEGELEWVEMMADPIGDIASQRIVSQFALTKFNDMMRYGWMLFGALGGRVDSEKGVSVEGIFEKPTANSDKLVALKDRLEAAKKRVDVGLEDEIFYAFIESFDRLWTVLKIMRTMQSDTRNAQGALWLENPNDPINPPTNVFLADGSLNPAIALDRNTGTSRHSERIFFDAYIDWLLSDKPGGGVATYPSEAAFYKFLREPYFYYDKDLKIIRDGRTWADWIFDKMGR